jgi:hypothetical protein
MGLMCGRPPHGKMFLGEDDERGRCGHVSGLLMRCTRPLALMKSAGPAPIQVIAFTDAEPQVAGLANPR